MATAIDQPLKWHGGKHYLAKWIISLMPPRCKNPNKPDPADPGWLHYVEGYAGGLAVLLQNDPIGISEVVNDINGGLTNFWRVLQDSALFAEFKRVLEAVPFSKVEWEDADHPLPIDSTPSGLVRQAVEFFVRCRQSMSGRMDCFTPLTRNRTRRGMNEQVSAWLSAIDGLPTVHARMMRVVVLPPTKALAVIRQQDGPRTLFYLDPPYLDETRTAKDVYAHEMTRQDHNELLSLLISIKGRFLLSGYRSSLYDQVAADHGWRRADMEIDNKSGKGDEKQDRIESVWMNY